MNKIMRITSVAVAGSFLFAACGSGSLSAEDQEFADTLAENLAASEDFSELYDKEDSTCIADGFVKGLGSDRLTEVKYTGDEEISDLDLTEDEQLKMVDAVFDCVDIKELMLSDEDTSEEEVTCLLDETGTDIFKESAVAEVKNDEAKEKELGEKISAAAKKCTKE